MESVRVKILLLIKNKQFCSDAEISDLSNSQKINYLTECFNEEDIIQFYNEYKKD